MIQESIKCINNILDKNRFNENIFFFSNINPKSTDDKKLLKQAEDQLTVNNKNFENKIQASIM